MYFVTPFEYIPQLIITAMAAIGGDGECKLTIQFSEFAVITLAYSFWHRK